MDAHVLPDNIAIELGRLAYTTQLCDAAGRSLGIFVPAFDPSQYEVIGPEPTPEELQRIRQSDEWYSTDEVLRHLESLQ
ncbi:MAG TPA: hypothetical protein VG056_02115 [Pirellulales bacterium]|jgi:hypothetical protein|nr:hypothetical protein [Pirellulales bacterium]